MPSKEPTLQPLSPREIQARVRAGASPEVVAAETGWPLDRVTRYAEPLLGERAYVAKQAAAVEISRSRGGATLHQSVSVRLDVDPDTEELTWDSYRNPEGRWVVTAFHGGSAVGTWLYEEVGRSVHPQDEAARALMGGGPRVVADPGVEAATSESPPVPTADTDTDTDTDRPEVTADDQEEAARPRLVSVTSDPLADQARATDASSSEDALFGEPAAAGEQSKPSSNSARSERTKRAKGKRGRASVPSWDEILFGATKSED